MNIRLALCAKAAFAVWACDQPPSEAGPVQTTAVPQQTPYVDPDAGRTLLRTTPVTPYLEAVSVRLFVRGDFDGAEDYIESEGRLLSGAQRKALEGALTIVSYDRPPDAAAACFVPHHFIRYFDRLGKQIGEIAICLCCHGARATPDVAGPAPDGVGHHYLDLTRWRSGASSLRWGCQQTLTVRRSTLETARPSLLRQPSAVCLSDASSAPDAPSIRSSSSAMNSARFSPAGIAGRNS
jgi:hypothetical protein